MELLTVNQELIEVYRETGVDVILRDAPYLIVATTPQEFLFGYDSARFSLEYVELYATAMGLGTLLGRLCNGGEFTK